MARTPAAAGTTALPAPLLAVVEEADALEEVEDPVADAEDEEAPDEVGADEEEGADEEDPAGVEDAAADDPEEPPAAELPTQEVSWPLATLKVPELMALSMPSLNWMWYAPAVTLTFHV